MAQRQKEPLRLLPAEERAELGRVTRASSEPAGRVARAKALLAVADGVRFTAATRAAGRRSGDAVAQLVARFNRHGVGALDAGHGGGPPVRYGPDERERILREFRRASDGLPTISTATTRRLAASRRTSATFPTWVPSAMLTTGISFSALAFIRTSNSAGRYPAEASAGWGSPVAARTGGR